MARIEGLTIGLDLDTMRVDSGLTDLKSKMKLVNSEMRSNLSAFDQSDKSIGKYEKRLEGLNKKLEVQKAITEKAQKNYEKMVAVHGEGSKEAEKAATAYNHESAQLQSLERYVNRTAEELNDLREEQRLAATGWGKFGQSMENLGGKLTKVGDKMKNIGKSMSMYVTAPIAAFGALAAKTGIDFDDSMAKVQAVSGATGEDLLRLRDKAKEMGATTKFSASESAEALNYMAMAGWKTEDMLDGIQGVMSLAAASGEDLAIVSDIVTDALTAFGMESKDSAHFADVLAAASSNANTNVGMLGKSFEYAAPVAGALGYRAEDVSVALGLMANAGIKADKSGTALRTMMTNLAKPSKEMKKAMDNLGISLTDANGEMKSWDQVMLDLRKSMTGMKEDQQAAAAATIFGKEAMSGALAVINASEEDYNKLSEAINNAEGSADRMAEVMEGTLGGTIRRIKSGLEGFAISIYEIMLPALTKGAAVVEKLVNWLNNLGPAVKLVTVVTGALAAAIGPVLLVAGTIISIIGSAMTALTPLIAKINRSGRLLTWIRTALTALTGPIGLVIGAITLLGTVFVAAYKKSKSFKDLIVTFGVQIKNTFNNFTAWIKPAFTAIGDFIDELKSKFVGFKKSIDTSSIVKGFQSLTKSVEIAFSGLNAVFSKLKPLVEYFAGNIWEGIKQTLSGFVDILLGLVKILTGIFTNDWKNVWNGVKNIFFGAIDLIVGAFKTIFIGQMIRASIDFVKYFPKYFAVALDWVKNVFLVKTKEISRIIWNWIKALPGKIKASTVATATAFVSWLTMANKKTREKLNIIWPVIKNWFVTLPGKIKAYTTNLATAFVGWLTMAKKKTSEKLSVMWPVIKNWFVTLPGKIKASTINLATAFVGWLTMANKKTSEKLSVMWPVIKNWFVALPGKIKAFTTTSATAFVGWLTMANKRSSDKLNEIWPVIKNWFIALPGKIKTFTTTSATAFVGWLTMANKKTSEKLSVMWPVIKNWFVTLPGKIKAFTTTSATAFVGWLTMANKRSSDKLNEIWPVIKNWFVALPGKIKTFTTTSATAFVGWLTMAKKKTSEKLDTIWPVIKNWFVELPGKITTSITGLATSFSSWLDSAKEKQAEKLDNMLQDIKAWFINLPSKIKEFYNGTGDGGGFKGWLEEQDKLNKEYFGGLGDKVKGWLSEEKKKIEEGFDTWTESLRGFFKGSDKDAEEGAESISDRFKETISNAKEKISKALDTWKESFFGFFRGSEDDAEEGAEGLVDRFKTTISNAKDKVLEGFENMWSNVKDWFNNIGEKEEVKNVGTNVVQSVAKGIEETDKTSIIDQVGKFIKEAFKIAMIAAFIVIVAMFRELFIAIGQIITKGSEIVRTGFDWLWSKAKEIFRLAIDWIIDLFKNGFIGEIIKKAEELKVSFKEKIRTMWDDIKTNFFAKIEEIKNNIKDNFVSAIVTKIEEMKASFKEKMRTMWEDIKINFSAKIDEIKKSVENSFVIQIIKSAISMKTQFIDQIKGMWTGVTEWFGKIVDEAKALPGKIGDGIRNAKDKAVSGMKAVGNSLIQWAGTPYNKVIDGVNWITDKLGIEKKIGHWDYPQYAKGTGAGGHPGGRAIFGEEGRELVKLPDGRSFLSPSTATLVDLPKGAHVLPNKQTEELLKFDLPHYAKGTPGVGGIFDATKNFASNALAKAKDIVSDVWDYMSNPSKLVDAITDKISVIKDKAQIPTNIVTGGFNTVKTNTVDAVKNFFKQAEDEGLAPGSGAPAFKWPVTSNFGYRMHPIHKTMRLHAGTDFGAPSGSPIPSTTGGRVSFAGRMGGFGNLVKVKSGIMEMFYAHMSRIMVSAGQAVKKGDILGLVGSTGDSTGPHLHYETRKNGTPINPMLINGFADGGLIKKEQLAMVGEGNYEEVIIPVGDPRKRTNAMKLLALAGKKLGSNGGSVSPGSLPNVQSVDDSHLLKIIEKLTEQVAETKEVVSLLAQLLVKDSNFYVEGRELARTVEPFVSDIQEFKRNRLR